MLAVSSLSNSDGRDIAAAVVADESFDGFLGGGVPMLEDIGIDFDEIFLGFDGVDMLPDLGDPDEIFADFSIDGQYGGDEMGKEAKALEVISGGELLLEKKEEGDKGLSQDQKEIASVTTFKENSNYEVSTPDLPSPKTKTEKSSKAKGNQAKRKVKVDWTLELHQRFVHAVELLGLDKAVPSRILELMGNVGLTRHNIASHLQKYRSHRKHLLAREAEAASWRQRQQMYSSTGMAVAAKTETSPWLTPTMAFPPHPPPIQPTYRPLHVWGHPPMDPNLVHMWPKHLQRPPPMPWPLPPSPHLSTWPTQHPRGPNALTNGMPYFPMPLPLPLPLPATRFPSPSVPGIPPHPLYRTDNAVSLKSKQLASPLQSFETHPSKESIDAAIGDVIAKPWLPLPLGLKPPSLEGVITELQKKGISKIPSIT